MKKEDPPCKDPIWKTKNEKDTKDLFHDHGQKFSDHGTYRYLELLNALKFRKFDAPLTMVEDAYFLACKYDLNAGICHMFADMAITLGEQNLLSEQETAYWLLHAQTMANKALELDSTYPKYHATLARILLRQQKFDEALIHIHQALHMEKPATSDHPQRIADYTLIKTSIIGERQKQALRQTMDKQRQITAELVQQVQETQGTLEKSTLKHIEILGLFAAIISFVIGSLQRGAGSSPLDAARIIVVLILGLVFAFACFGILFGTVKGRRLRINVLFIVFSALMLVGALAWLQP